MAAFRSSGCALSIVCRVSVACATALVVLLTAAARALAQAPTPTPLYLHCPVTGFDGRTLVALTAVNPDVVGSQLAAVDQANRRVLVLQPRGGENLFDVGACDRALGSTPIPVNLDRPLAIAAAPLGADDADIDLVVLGVRGILPLFSDGAGGFAPPVLPVPPTPTPAPQFTPYPAGDGPRALTLADFDRDGSQDIAVATNGGNSIELLFGKPDGTFEKEQPLRAGVPLIAVATDKFGRDAHLDLAAISDLDPDLLIFLSETDGSCPRCFKAPTRVPIGQFPAKFAIGRFNNDDCPDLAVLSNDRRLLVLIEAKVGNQCEASFEARETFHIGGKPRAIAVGRFNDDIFDDVAVAVSESTLCPTRPATPVPGQTPEATPGLEPTAMPTASPTTTQTPESRTPTAPIPSPTLTATPGAPQGHCIQLFLSDREQDGRLSPGPIFPVGANPQALIVAQLDSESRPDIVSLNNDANEGLTILLSGNPPPTPTVTVTNTPTITGTPTDTPSPTVTPTLEPPPPPTPRPTNTCPPDQFCVQGESCAVVAVEEKGSIPWPLLGMAALALLLRRRR